MTSGRVLLWLIFLALCLVFVGACLWIVWRVIWPWDVQWIVFGFNAFVLMKLWLAGLVVTLPFAVIMVIFGLFRKRLIDDLHERLSFLPGERALRTSRLSDGLHTLFKSRKREELLRRLRMDLPQWPVSTALTRAAEEVLELDRSIPIARAAGVPQDFLVGLNPRVEEAAQFLWHSADRIAAAAAQNVSPSRLRDVLNRETEKLTSLREATIEARHGLAEITVMGSKTSKEELAAVEKRFRRLAIQAEAWDEFSTWSDL